MRFSEALFFLPLLSGVATAAPPTYGNGHAVSPVCGLRGYDTNSACQLSSHECSTIAKCATSCKKNSHCKSYGYCNISNTCRLYSKSVRKHVKKNNKSSQVFYDRACRAPVYTTRRTTTRSTTAVDEPVTTETVISGTTTDVPVTTETVISGTTTDVVVTSTSTTSAPATTTTPVGQDFILQAFNGPVPDGSNGALQTDNTFVFAQDNTASVMSLNNAGELVEVASGRVASVTTGGTRKRQAQAGAIITFARPQDLDAQQVECICTITASTLSCTCDGLTGLVLSDAGVLGIGTLAGFSPFTPRASAAGPIVTSSTASTTPVTSLTVISSTTTETVVTSVSTTPVTSLTVISSTTTETIVTTPSTTPVTSLTIIDGTATETIITSSTTDATTSTLVDGTPISTLLTSSTSTDSTSTSITLLSSTSSTESSSTSTSTSITLLTSTTTASSSTTTSETSSSTTEASSTTTSESTTSTTASTTVSTTSTTASSTTTSASATATACAPATVNGPTTNKIYTTNCGKAFPQRLTGTNFNVIEARENIADLTTCIGLCDADGTCNAVNYLEQGVTGFGNANDCILLFNSVTDVATTQAGIDSAAAPLGA